MNSTGNNSDKVGYRVILLLVVGLTAFSSAMKELNQFQQLSLDASRLVAQLTQTLTPAEVPQPPPPPEMPALVKAESCDETKQSAPSVDLPWLSNVEEETCDTDETRAPVIAKRTRNAKVDIAKLNKLRQIDIDPVQFEVRILPGGDGEADEISIPEIPAPPAFAFKTRTRKQAPIRINTRDREMILKTLNRSINLRIAG